MVTIVRGTVLLFGGRKVTKRQFTSAIGHLKFRCIGRGLVN